MAKLRLVAWDLGNTIQNIQEGDFGSMGLYRRVTELLKQPSVVRVVVTSIEEEKDDEGRTSGS